MKLKLKMSLLALYLLIAGFIAWLLQPLSTRRRMRRQSFALANALGLVFEKGRESLQIDPTAALPVGQKWLVYMRGSTIYYAKPSNGTALPLGISPDSPYQASDFMAVDRLGAKPGIQLAISVGAITVDHLVYDAGATTLGTVGDLSTAANGTYWVIGRAAATVAAAAQEITFIPFDPYQLTVASGVFTYPVNPT